MRQNIIMSIGWIVSKVDEGCRLTPLLPPPSVRVIIFLFKASRVNRLFAAGGHMVQNPK